MSQASGYASDNLDDEKDDDESSKKKKKTQAKAKGKAKDLSQMTEEELAKAKSKAKVKAKAMKQAKTGGGNDEDDEDIEEELGYISPLDTVDPYVSFKQALTGQFCAIPAPMHPADFNPTAFQMKNGNAYQLGTTSLVPEQQTLLMEVMRIAEERSQTQTA